MYTERPCGDMPWEGWRHCARTRCSVEQHHRDARWYSVTDEPSLTVTCLEAEQCNVYFEPWGSEHILKRGDAFSVRSGALAKGKVEVSFVLNGISICFSSDDEVVVTDKSGKRLAI